MRKETRETNQNELCRKWDQRRGETNVLDAE